MSSFGLYFASVAVPIAQRALTGLGIGVVSYVGLDAVFTQLQNSILQNWGAMGAGPLAILSMSGVSEALGITLGALSARLAMIQLSRLGRVI